MFDKNFRVLLELIITISNGTRIANTQKLCYQTCATSGGKVGQVHGDFLGDL
jgi:hypothetical protein